MERLAAEVHKLKVQKPESDVSSHKLEEEEIQYRLDRPPIKEIRYEENKLDISEFEGKLDPEEFIDWLYSVERAFDLREITDERKVKLVALKLKKYASYWWENLKTQRTKAGKEKIKNWEKMKKELKRRFLPTSYQHYCYSELLKLEQGTKAVDEYTREFELLMIKCNLEEPEDLTTVRYLKGLKTEIADLVELHPYITFSEVCNLAHKVDLQIKQKRKTTPPRPYFKPNFNKGSPSGTKGVVVTPVQAKTFEPTPKNRIKCFRCQGLGHIASECPNKRVITIMEATSLQFESEEQKEVAESEEELIEEEADVGELLMLRRALKSTPTLHMDVQRENLFQTRGTIQGKVCNIIVDGGSFTNVASEELLKKLKISTEPHPQPYTLQWLNTENGLKVTSHGLAGSSSMLVGSVTARHLVSILEGDFIELDDLV